MKLLCDADLACMRAESLNRPETPFVRARRVKDQRTRAQLRALIALPPRDYPVGAFLKMPGRFVVELTRIAPGKPLDAHDNLPGSMKAIVDGICDRLGIDDGDTARIRFVYAQEKGPWCVRFKVSLEDLAPASSAENSKTTATEQAGSGGTTP